MGIVFGFGFAFGTGGLALTYFGVGAAYKWSEVFFGERKGNPSIFTHKKSIYPTEPEKKKKYQSQFQYSNKKCFSIFEEEQRKRRTLLNQLDRRKFK